ncbi:MAG TPA: A/G-specific adenine glycosylase [Polyangiaceae bacterium]|nr:A/G-specific adenine glycosylase [Polyangiaceae bacterium]
MATPRARPARARTAPAAPAPPGAPRAPAAPAAAASAPDAAFASAFDHALGAWFARHARDLPWRRDRAAYRVWVSEVMLQQTRVATVLAYYDRFLARFPDVASLAAAAEGEVLALWSGLGYYRRARALHRGAREVVERFGGELPRTVDELRTIGGIGAYTAGAVASLAFGVRAPLVDGNVMRVYARVFGDAGDIKASGTQRRLWSVAASMVEHARAPGPFNEALMELGATVCLPRDPLCLVCPVRALCRAFAEGRQNELPVVGAKKPVPEVHAAALVARRGGEVLLGRRRGDALFGGLWEAPMVEGPDPKAAEAALRAFAPRARAAGHVRHVLSHRRLEVAVFAGEAAPGAPMPALYDAVEFVPEAGLASRGVSTFARKVLAAAPAGAEGEGARAKRGAEGEAAPAKRRAEGEAAPAKRGAEGEAVPVKRGAAGAAGEGAPAKKGVGGEGVPAKKGAAGGAAVKAAKGRVVAKAGGGRTHAEGPRGRGGAPRGGGRARKGGPGRGA